MVPVSVAEPLKMVTGVLELTRTKEQVKSLTTNVPLFKKLRDIIFLAGQSLYEPFQGTF